MPIKKRNVIFFSLLLISVASLLFFVYLNQKRNVEIVFTERVKEVKNLFDRVHTLESKGLENLSVDYTYWDDLVEFVQTEDQAWAEENLDTALETYGADAIWIYNTENTLVYNVEVDKNGNISKGQELPLALSYRLNIFEEHPLRHFYIQTENNVIEIRAATIHPSNDPDRLTSAQGFFFTGRYLDEEFLEKLASGPEMTITVKSQVANTTDQTDVSSGRMKFYRELKDFNEKTIAYFEVNRELLGIQTLSQTVNNQFIILIPLALLSTGLLWFVFYLNNKSREAAEKIVQERTSSLRESEQKYRLLAENSKEMICLLSPTGEFEYISNSCELITGYKSSELIGKSQYDFIHPDDLKTVRNQAHGLAIIQKNSSSLEYRFKKKDGSYVWLETVTQPVLLREGKVDKIQTSSRDITERKNDEEAIARQTQDLERMNKAMVDRELKMIELKKEIEKLSGKKKGSKDEK